MITGGNSMNLTLKVTLIVNATLNFISGHNDSIQYHYNGQTLNGKKIDKINVGPSERKNNPLSLTFRLKLKVLGHYPTLNQTPNYNLLTGIGLIISPFQKLRMTTIINLLWGNLMSNTNYYIVIWHLT